MVRVKRLCMSSARNSNPEIREKRLLNGILTNPSMQSLAFPSPWGSFIKFLILACKSTRK